MFPPVPTLTREAERDMDLGGYKVPEGRDDRRASVQHAQQPKVLAGMLSSSRW